MSEIEAKIPMTMQDIDELCIKAKEHNVRIVVDMDIMQVTVEPVKRNDETYVKIDTIRHP